MPLRVRPTPRCPTENTVAGSVREVQELARSTERDRQGYKGSVVAWFAARAVYKRQHRRLLASVRKWLPGEDVQDVAVAHQRFSVWPTMAGIAVLVLGAVLGSDDRASITLVALVLGFGLLVIGWVASPAILIVATTDAVILLQGRRRTYEPVAVLERVERSAWLRQEEMRTRRLWVPGLWKKHLPSA